MKTSQDPRHKKRQTLVSELFASSFLGQKASPEILPIIESLTDVDAKIAQAAPEWPLQNIAKIDLAILRLAVWELTVAPTEPPKVVIDEAVELAKELGNEQSSSFINGVLGTIMKRTAL